MKFENLLMASSLIQKYFDVATTEKVENLHWFFVFGRIKLKFAVRGNFRLLISNLNSKTQYQFEILRTMPLSLSSIMIFSPVLPQELVTMVLMNDLSSIFNFKRYCR